MNSINTSCRIGVFYDGNFLLHASNYYNYIHPERRRLSLNGLHRFIRHRVAEEAGCETVKCQISVAHYFRGRLNASEAAMRGNQLYNDRVFDDILMSEGVNTHYLPLRNVQGRREERGVDVWLALEAYELVLSGTIDIIVLIVSDTDYTPLMRKIRAAGIPIMLLSWEFEYLTDDGIKMVTKTSHELLSLATYPIAMHEEIERGLEQNNPVVRNLFVCNEGCPPETEHTVEVSEILSLKIPQQQPLFPLPGRRGQFRRPGRRRSGGIHYRKEPAKAGCGQTCPQITGSFARRGSRNGYVIVGKTLIPRTRQARKIKQEKRPHRFGPADAVSL